MSAEGGIIRGPGGKDGVRVSLALTECVVRPPALLVGVIACVRRDPQHLAAVHADRMDCMFHDEHIPDAPCNCSDGKGRAGSHQIIKAD